MLGYFSHFVLHLLRLLLFSPVGIYLGIYIIVTKFSMSFVKKRYDQKVVENGNEFCSLKVSKFNFRLLSAIKFLREISVLQIISSFSEMENPEGGEQLSKNELKRRMKAEKKAAEKAEKAAEKAKNQDPAKPAKSEPVKDEMSGEDITPNEYFKLRSKAVEELKKDPKTHPYPHKFHVGISLTDFIEKYSTLSDGESLDDVEVRVAGRIHAIRESGAKLRFFDLRGEGTKVQVMANARAYKVTHSVES